MPAPDNTVTDLDRTIRLSAGDECEFEFPARKGWRKGVVVKNGGPYYWHVLDVETDKVCRGLYIEHVRAPGTDPWGR